MRAESRKACRQDRRGAAYIHKVPQKSREGLFYVVTTNDGMVTLLSCTAVAGLASSAAGAVIGAIPSQTMGGFGEPIFALPLPTAAPEVELVKRRLEKKDATNICTEWTIPRGYGQPECVNSETCLFTSAGGYYYEGCGQTSKRYDWNTGTFASEPVHCNLGFSEGDGSSLTLTECWDYPQSGTAPLSQVFWYSTSTAYSDVS